MFRFLRRASLGVAAGTTAVFIPPLESLPDPLFQYRVTCEGLGRLGRCAWVGAQTLYLFKWQLRGETEQEVYDSAHELTAARLVRAAMLNGAVFVKIGQNFCVQSHIVPPIYTRALKRLQEKVVERPLSEIDAVIEADFGKTRHELYTDFQEEPIGSASLAQVHRARIKDGPHAGEDVAVKVQYYDVQSRFEGDFAVILLFLSISGMLFPGYDFGQLVRQGKRVLEEELDFVGEARNIKTVNAELRKEFGTKVRCPEVFDEYVTPRVLVTEYIDGYSPEDPDAMRRHGIDPAEIGRLFSRAFAYQLFNKDVTLVHADPHPGNLRAHKDKKTGEVQAVMFDLGLCYSVPAAERQSLAEVFTACATTDEKALMEVMQKLNLPTGDGPDSLEVGVFGSMFLSYPFKLFSMNDKKATKDAVALMREGQDAAMPVVTAMLEKLPYSFALALRTISTYKHTHKMLGRPCNRVAEMLKYSIVTARASEVGWIKMQWLVFRLWWDQFKIEMTMRLVAWWDPRVQELEAYDELLTIG